MTSAKLLDMENKRSGWKEKVIDILEFSTPRKRYKPSKHLLACDIDLEGITQKIYYQAEDHVTSAKLLGIEKGTFKPLLGAVVGAVTGIVVGYYIPRVGVAAGGLAGAMVGFAVGVVVTTLSRFSPTSSNPILSKIHDSVPTGLM